MPPRIVVGVDGSERSKEALRWAIHQATDRGGSGRGDAWQVPVRAGLAQAIDGRPDYQAEAREILAAAITDTRAAGSDAEVHPHVVPGPPVQVLADAAEGAEGAEGLVVGSRERGGLTDALPGSVSRHSAHHAPCPVLIVRGTHGGTGGPG